MESPKNVNRKPVANSTRKPWFLGFGFHKLKVADFDIKVTAAGKLPYEQYKISLKLRTEAIEDFKGHEDDNFQKVTVKPFFFDFVDDEVGTAKAMLALADGDAINKGDDLYRAAKNVENLRLLSVIAAAHGVQKEFEALSVEGTYNYLKAALDLLVESQFYAWYALTEKDNEWNGKVYSSIGISYDSVFGEAEVSEVKIASGDFDIAFADGKTMRYARNKYNYIKLAAKPNDTPNEGSSIPEMPSLPQMANDDLPF